MQLPSSSTSETQTTRSHVEQVVQSAIRPPAWYQYRHLTLKALVLHPQSWGEFPDAFQHLVLDRFQTACLPILVGFTPPTRPHITGATMVLTFRQSRLPYQGQTRRKYTA